MFLSRCFYLSILPPFSLSKNNKNTFSKKKGHFGNSPQRGPLLPEFLDISHTPGKNPLFPAKLLDLKLEDPHVLQPLVVLDLAFIQHRLLDLDLLIKQSQLIVATNELRPEDISLANDLER